MNKNEVQTPILEVSHMGIEFGGLKAVNDFSLTIGSSEIVGLIGPNGAGKTTVFNLLTGVYKPTSGTIKLCGQVMNGKKTYQFIRAGAARTFQNISLFNQMSVIDNVKVALGSKYKYGYLSATFHLPKYRKAEKAADAEARELLKIFGLDKKADFTASNLPYGDQRKLEIARALATGMKVLFLDEPAAGMNPTETAELLECIRIIRQRFNIAILLIEHDMSLVMNICERIMVIDYGQTIAHGKPEEIASNKRVIEAYLGKDDEDEDNGEGGNANA